MPTGVTIYKSTDASAPSLSGTAGSLASLLDAVLVNGYGAKPAAGWTTAYSSGNKRAYRQGAGNLLYCRLNDGASGTGGAKEALLRGFETMSDVDTGTGPMPTNAQSALTENSLIVRKSNTADATARAWIAAADARTWYLFVLAADVASTYWGFLYGDFYSNLSADAWRVAIIARATENSSAAQAGDTDTLQNSTFTTVLAGHFVQRSRTGAAGSLTLQKTDILGAPAPTVGCGQLSNIPFPNAEDGGLYLAPVYLHDVTTAPASSVRGRLRGVWSPTHPASAFGDQDTFSGVGDLAGRSWLILKLSARGGCIALETSDTWDTST